MYIIILNFSMHNMLMRNIISKVIQLQDLRSYSTSIRTYMLILKIILYK
jgi:hypothetical protein